ncbi:DUF427 domain-containing protein [Thermosynechococcus sp. HN-54]|uniref:DUF427 domain-containing protein n=1 Tax=Thermosynechococcus sp. HN-54 TaxID=2933959 RepID=UPI00202CD887|nr:DUF427 domain-containing protein [Thermosynechococcus sp. HN-54]URR35972.1 DUF427 domain-containing protein [Thermosynechococcus sp. HN-54]
MQRIPPTPGQESVWDYPRPPRVEPTSKHLRVVFNDVVIADTQRGQRVLETSHPPVYYFPPEDVQSQYLVPSPRQTFCEWKGQGAYYHVKVGDRQANNAAWYYPNPTPPFAPIRNFIAFYASLMDECTVDGVVVIPQPGGFYGGWITPDIVGPFKGAPGTWGW